ncbi:MAG: gliding motility-associated C-terminal domain-containing protein, partial [Bacteroidetes bacterium]
PFIRLLDSLPPALRIVSVDHQPPVSELIQGPGGHVLEVMLTDMLLGIDSVVITVEVPPEAQGSYASQASLRAFPPAIGFRIASDDPATETPEDASSLAVSNLMVELGEARYVCAGEQLLLKPAVQPPSVAVSYQWSNGSTQPELLVQQTGWYSLQVQDGCARATDSVYVEVAPALPRLELGPDRFILQGESLQLSFETDVNGPAQLEWSVSNETPLSCYDCPMPQIRPLEHSQVFLRLRDEHGCAALDSMRIWVNAERDIFVANVLTPNGDGINDVFYVQGRGLGEVQQLAVFDRWGKLVFSGRGALNDPAHGWNGQHPQGAAPEGVYFWQLDLRFPDGRQQLLRGVVNLFR